MSAAFLNDYYQPSHPNPKQRDRNLKIEFLEVEGPVDEAVHGPMQARLIPEGRKDLRPLVKELADRAELLEPAADSTMIQSSFVVGLKTLPVRYAIRPAA